LLTFKQAPRSWGATTNDNGKDSTMVNLIVWLVVGGIVGWIASLIMKTDAQQGVFLNIVVGVVGAGIAGFLISPMVGVPSINENAFSLGAFVVSLLGAVILLGVVRMLRGRSGA